MKYNLNEFSKKVRSTYYGDLTLLNSKRNYVKKIYAKEQFHGEGGNEPINGSEPIVSREKIKTCYNRCEGIHLPWISGRLYSEISKHNKVSLPKVINIPKKTNVEESDIDCIDRYSVRSRAIRPRNLKFLSKCGIHAAKQIGLFDFQARKSGRRISTTESVISTSKNTSSGFPLFVRKHDDRAISDTIAWLDRFLSKPTLYGIIRNPCVILHRYQPKLDEKKRTLDAAARQVWCEPQRIIALEQYFFGSFIEDAMTESTTSKNPTYISGIRNSLISSLAVKPLRGGLVNNSIESGGGRSVFSLDFSKYDSSLSDYMFDIFFGIVGENINFKNDEEKKAFDLLRIYSKYTPYIYNGDFRLQLRGIGSGSKITNLFDTWYNVTLWNAAMDIDDSESDCYENLVYDNHDFINMTIPEDLLVEYVSVVTCYDHKKLKVCGDDTAICCRQSLIDVHKCICNSMGMKISVRHRAHDVSDDIFFLGRFWNDNNEPFNSEFYISCHIIFRSSWFVQDKVEFDVTKDNIEFGRISSICGALSNGLLYVRRTFSEWNRFNRYLHKNNTFTDLTSWDSQYNRRELTSILNWRLF